MLVSFVLYVGLGMLWYNKILFGVPWMKLNKFREEDLEMKPKEFIYTFAGSIFGIVFTALLLEVGGVYTFVRGLVVGLLIAGVLFTTSSSQVVYSGKHWKLWLIDAGYHAASLIIVGILLGLWNLA